MMELLGARPLPLSFRQQAFRAQMPLLQKGASARTERREDFVNVLKRCADPENDLLGRNS